MNVMNSGRGRNIASSHLGRNRALINYPNVGTLITLIRLDLGPTFIYPTFVVLQVLPKSPPNLQWRWRCLRTRLALHVLHVPSFPRRIYLQVFRCTALFTPATDPRLLTTLTIPRGAPLLTLCEPVLVQFSIPWVNLTVTYRTFR